VEPSGPFIGGLIAFRAILRELLALRHPVYRGSTRAGEPVLSC
jgi:hypothetical protein